MSAPVQDRGHPGRGAPGWLAEAVVGMYPRAWRHRYGDELAALLAERPPGWREVADLLRRGGCALLCR